MVKWEGNGLWKSDAVNSDNNNHPCFSLTCFYGWGGDRSIVSGRDEGEGAIASGRDKGG
ncbi:MAG: hypothetical protein VKJ64_14350 [Leptolyngbyaceae bacterium]|nr:hypothetical protein [Leptolyngbyaceae bacterium]